MNKTNHSILIIGGAGYIGSHTVLELLNAGQSVVVVDNFVNSSKGLQLFVALFSVR